MASQTPVTPGYYSGVDGRFFVGSWAAGSPPTVTYVELPVTKITVDASTPMSDRTNSMTAGQQAGTRTIKSLSGSVSCVVPDTPGGDPIVEEGNTYPIVAITHDGRGYACYAYFETVSASTETKGDLGYDISFKSNYIQGTGITTWNGTDLPSAILTALGITGQGTGAGNP